MAGKYPGDLLERLIKRRGLCPHEGSAGLGGAGQRSGLVLGGDGRQHGGLPPPHAAVAELHAHSHIPHGLQPRGRDREGRHQGNVQGPPLGPGNVHHEGLLQPLEPQAHRWRRRRRCDGKGGLGHGGAR